MKLYRATLKVNEKAHYGEGGMVTHYVYTSGNRNLGKELARLFKSYGSAVVIEKVERLAPSKKAKHLCRFGGTYSTITENNIEVKA